MANLPEIVESVHGELDCTGSYGGREILCARLRWEPSDAEAKELEKLGFQSLEWVSVGDYEESVEPKYHEEPYRGKFFDGSKESNEYKGWLETGAFVILVVLLIIFTR